MPHRTECGKLTILALFAATLSLAPPVLAQGGTWGRLGNGSHQWDIPNEAPAAFVPIHVVLLRDGSLLVWNRLRGSHQNPTEHFAVLRITSSGSYNYDTVTRITVPRLSEEGDLLCAGHNLLESGDVLIAGGHAGDDEGIKDLLKYTPGDSALVHLGVMDTDGGRWYPSIQRLPDGRIMILAGTDKRVLGRQAPFLEPYPTLFLDGNLGDGHKLPGDLNFYQSLLGAQSTWIYYPFLFTDPDDGNSLYVGPRTGSETSGVFLKLNLATLGWSALLSSYPVDNCFEWYPSGTMDDGVVLKCAGSIAGHENEAVAHSLYIDLLGQRTWTAAGENDEEEAGRMLYPRKNHGLIVLPDGKFVVFGGNQQYESDPVDQENHTELDRCQPEVWDPASPTAPWQLWNWPSLEADRIQRAYHSIYLLLPNAKVLVAGGEGDVQASGRVIQVFSPPYGGDDDWEADRPTLSSAPANIDYDATFEVSATPAEGRTISKMWLTPLGSMTHAFNQAQGSMTLTKSGTSGTITVTAPASAKLAAPGCYMLFAVDSEGVPSIARFVKLGDGFNRMFTESVNIVHGAVDSYSIEQLFLTDGIYLGHHSITSETVDGVNKLQLEFLSQDGGFDAPDKFRFRCVMKADPLFSPSTIGGSLLFYNVVEDRWDGGPDEVSETGVALSLVNDTAHRFQVVFSSGAGDYANENGQVEARLTFSRTALFRIKLDSVEFGGR